MTMEIRVPQLPESVADATLVAWRKQPGEAVSRDENLADLETDKVVLEVPAPAAGVIKEFKVVQGATVKSGDLLAIFEPGAAAAKPVPAASATAVAAAPAPSAAKSAAAEKLSPAVRRAVEESGVDPASVSGSGRDGRLTKGDVLAAIDAGTARLKSAATPAPAAVAAAAAAPAERREERVKMTRLRQTIARRLKEAQNSAAMLTTFNDVDMTAVIEARAKYKDMFEKKHGIRLGFMSFFAKAVVLALKDVPSVGAAIEGDEIIYKDYADLGVAVSSPGGLVVPILRNAQAKSFAQIEKDIADFGDRARKGTLKIDELQGGNFTISNGGVFGSLLSTPILNPPQSGVLGLHRVEDRPVVKNGQIVIRPMMYLALSYDHRLIDGREAVTFLVRVKEAIEDPARLLIDL